MRIIKAKNLITAAVAVGLGFFVASCQAAMHTIDYVKAVIIVAIVTCMTFPTCELVRQTVIFFLQVEVLYVIKNVALSPEELCGLVLGPDCGRPYNPYHQVWNISLPDTPKPPVTPITPPKVLNSSVVVV